MNKKQPAPYLYFLSKLGISGRITLEKRQKINPHCLIPWHGAMVKSFYRGRVNKKPLPSGKPTELAGKSPFSIGNTSSFRVHFPASYVSLPEGNDGNLYKSAWWNLHGLGVNETNSLIIMEVDRSDRMDKLGFAKFRSLEKVFPRKKQLFPKYLFESHRQPQQKNKEIQVKQRLWHSINTWLVSRNP